jgi:photosystem II stability/assembly factor-like uncharacterized protein
MALLTTAQGGAQTPPVIEKGRPVKATARPDSAATDSTPRDGLEWRNVGPFRGGRVTAVAGVPSQPLTFYMGAAGGGVWKTEDAGTSWRNVSDGFFRTGTIGAIAVADVDPNVIYVGTGEAPIRGVASSHGDGVYKSTDAGRTWRKIGLTESRQISRVLVHPRDPDLVYVAAQGSRWGPSAERGIYRSNDGGATWKRVHQVDQTTGPSDLAMDATNPRILYAGYWDHQRTPWQVRSGGRGSGVYKSTDGGDSWTRLTEGLPTGVMGKIGVAVSPANPDRVWALVEADSGGLYRSDDAGKSWRLVNGDRLLRARAWYYTHVFADPRDAERVYVLNAPFLRSTDGGRTFQTVSTPHGDNHALWINPSNPDYMINGNDGGANVSLNGAATWSTQGNQPTAQFYRVAVDDKFPYNLYAGQQDNTSVMVPSRTAGPGIDVQSWLPDVGGCESAHVAFDPAQPRYIYAGCYQGIISEYDRETGLARNIMAYPSLGLAEPSNEQKYRFNWSAPIVTSPHDRRVIYHAGNVLFRSRDRGRTWEAISADLTRNDKSKQGPGGTPITNEGAGGEVYGTIQYVAESPKAAGTIWAGTDDGLVQLTRDGGKSWTNVTPPGVGEALVNAIDASPHDPGSALVAITRYKLNDNTPFIFRTTDYGRTWTRVVNGIRAGDVVRVAREDPERRGLLFAGTETGAYVSYDAGARWQSLQRNLPAVPVTDLQVHAGDLVASTEGRGFWILDDVSPLRQMSAAVAKAPVHLFKPRPAARVTAGSGTGAALGKNPPNGAILYYSLPRALDSATVLTIDVLDSAGRAVRAFTSQKRKAVDAPGATAPTPLPTKAGLNRFVWDLRTEPVTRVPGVFLAQNPQGYRVAPGSYQIRLTMAPVAGSARTDGAAGGGAAGRSAPSGGAANGGTTRTERLDVLADPRSTLAADDLRQQVALSTAVYGRVNDIHQTVIRLRDVRDQVDRLAQHAGALPDSQLVRDSAKALSARITAVEGALIQPKHKTFQDVINFRNQLNDHYLYLGEALDESEGAVTSGMRERLTALEQDWSRRQGEATALLDRDVAAFNAMVQKHGAPGVIVPAPPRAAGAPLVP